MRRQKNRPIAQIPISPVDPREDEQIRIHVDQNILGVQLPQDKAQPSWSYGAVVFKKRALTLDGRQTGNSTLELGQRDEHDIAECQSF